MRKKWKKTCRGIGTRSENSTNYDFLGVKINNLCNEISQKNYTTEQM